MTLGSKPTNMPQLRILVVDDAVVMRKLITETLRQDPELEVVGMAANGKIALQKIPQVNPDLITLDMEMPEMDGWPRCGNCASSIPSCR